MRESRSRDARAADGSGVDVTGAFGKYVWIPRAVDIDGDVLTALQDAERLGDLPARFERAA